MLQSVHMDAYQKFLQSKVITTQSRGIEPGEVNPKLFDFQRDIVKWAVRKGKAAIFANCGLGKTFCELEWARLINKKTLLLCPLAVGKQTVREGKKLGIEAIYSREPIDAQITVANYEILERFNPDDYEAVILGESSIIKHFDGKIRNQLMDRFRDTPFKLAETATPSPNSFMELGNHSEFLGSLTRTEMLSTFFTHDGGDTSQWRLKGHASKEFWKWVCSFAVMIRMPSDLGYSDDGFVLPPLYIHERQVEVERCSEGRLFALPAITLQERQRARADSTLERGKEVAGIVATKPGEQWIVWCNLNIESQTATKLIPGAVEITGSDSPEFKEQALIDFIDGKTRVIVTKGDIFGWGTNLQSSHNMVLYGLSDSWEMFYQILRRQWRFGQKHPVDCYIVTSSLEGEVVANIKRKEADAQRMAEEMLEHMRDINTVEVAGRSQQVVTYDPQVEMVLPSWI